MKPIKKLMSVAIALVISVGGLSVRAEEIPSSDGESGLVPGKYTNTDFDELVTLQPGSYEFANVNFERGLKLESGEYKIKNDGSSSTNTAAFVSGAGASITFSGKGKFEITGADITEPLFTAKDLYITKGTFAINVSSAIEKTAAVSLLGNFGLSGEGKLTMSLAGTQPYGIELTNRR